VARKACILILAIPAIVILFKVLIFIEFIWHKYFYFFIIFILIIVIIEKYTSIRFIKFLDIKINFNKRRYGNYQKRQVFISIIFILYVLFTLSMLSEYRWEISEPFIEYLSEDDYRFIRHEKDRWTGITWSRNYSEFFYSYPDEIEVERMTELFIDYNAGRKEGDYNYEYIRDLFSPNKCPLFWKEHIDNTPPEVINKEINNRIILTMFSDILILLGLLGLAYSIAIYWYIAKN
jgi:hypothetical protein